MKKISWLFKGGWLLGALAIFYQIIILLGVGEMCIRDSAGRADQAVAGHPLFTR